MPDQIYKFAPEEVWFTSDTHFGQVKAKIEAQVAAAKAAAGIKMSDVEAVIKIL